MKLFQALIMFFSAVTSIKCAIVVNTTGGQLEGARIHTGLYFSFFTFKGIPYAEPPVGDLRFKAPLPHRGWSGVRDASKHGNVCATNGFIGLMGGGHEDCLFLNVYTTDVHANRPVLFWIYGGAYILGDGNSLIYGPDLLMKEDIVVVTLNYRLSAFGFLSTGDKHAQGNYALKDIVLALKWVQANIRSFGGDPGKVTIAGQSAGAVSVHSLLLSDTTEGLFQQVIMMSGSALIPFGFQPHPRAKAEALGRKLGLKFNSTETLVEQLRAVDYKEILKHERGIEDQDEPLGMMPFDFVVTAEPADSLDERLITDTPENILLRGNVRRVPTLAGSVSKEGLLYLMKTLIDPNYMDAFNDHPEYFVPASYNISDNTRVNEVASAFKKIYFNGRKIVEDMKDDFATFVTDAAFKFSLDRAVRFMASSANASSNPIYRYEFSYDGALNFIKTLMFLKSYNGACHTDDIFYLFSPAFPMFVWPNDHAHTVQRRVVRMWSNFVKTGNPTPTADELLNIEWPKYDLDEELHLDIGHDLNVQNYSERLRVWREFQQKFTNHN